MSGIKDENGKGTLFEFFLELQVIKENSLIFSVWIFRSGISASGKVDSYDIGNIPVEDFLIRMIPFEYFRGTFPETGIPTLWAVMRYN